MSGHTPGPWTCDWTRAGKNAWKIVGADHLGVATILVTQARDASEKEANARLIAAAPDHAMIASALCSGAARWEPFASGSGGEFCIGGLRHATNLDQFGVPVMTDGMRAAIAEATGEQP